MGSSCLSSDLIGTMIKLIWLIFITISMTATSSSANKYKKLKKQFTELKEDFIELEENLEEAIDKNMQEFGEDMIETMDENMQELDKNMTETMDVKSRVEARVTIQKIRFFTVSNSSTPIFF